MEMTDLVNSKLPPEEQFSILFGSHRLFDLRRKYRQLFPNGDLLKRHDRLIVISASSLVVTVGTQLVVQSFWG